MSELDKKVSKSVPSIPFKTYIAFIERLHSTAVPPMIDGSLLHTMSGSMKSQLLSSLRFLNLIDLQNNVQESMHDLIKSYKSDTWSSSLKEVVAIAYSDAIVNVNIDSGTALQLDDAFKKNYSIDGQVLEKAVRFYLAALDECGIKYSPHFKVRRVRKSAIKKKVKPKKKNQEENNLDDFDDNNLDNNQAERAKFRIPIPGKGDCIIALPTDLEQGDWDMVKIMLDAYVTRITNSNVRD